MTHAAWKKPDMRTIRVCRFTGFAAMLLGMLGIVLAIITFPYEDEEVRILLLNYVASPFLFIPLGWIIFCHSRLLEKLVNMDAGNEVPSLSKDDEKTFRHLRLFRFSGILMMIVGIIGIGMGTYDYSTGCQHEQRIGLMILGFAIGYVPLGWLVAHLIGHLVLAKGQMLEQSKAKT